MLKKSQSFLNRTGIKSHFDSGDVITNNETILIVMNVIVMSDNKMYYKLCNITGYHITKPYIEINNEYKLLKEHDDKIQSYISNDGYNNGDDVWNILINNGNYPKYFEKEYNKINDK